eukprot:XP_004917355.1 PREDICTED: uncharacterized protein C15orf52 homolog isoform X1 [Xenopus tropicalis]
MEWGKDRRARLNPESFVMDDECQKQEAVPDGEVKRKQKDAELDKKIEALRKKNEALIRRYQEIEEDRKNADKIGMAVTSRRPKPESLTITITKTPNEKRVVSESFIGLSDSEEEDEQSFTFRMGKKVELEVTMDKNSKGKRVVAKKTGQDSVHGKTEPPGLTNDRQMDNLFTFGRGRRMQIAITMENEQTKKSNEKKRTSSTKEQNKGNENGPLVTCSGETLTMTELEHLEYMRWKKEREQIDQERLARHKNSKGEWRRAWDAEKTQNMFDGDYSGIHQEGFCGRRAGIFGGKKPLDKQTVGDNKGKQTQAIIENVSKPLPTISSNAKGKDRLTGRAQRWDTAEGLDSANMLDGISLLGISECKEYSGFMPQLKGSEQSFKQYSNAFGRQEPMWQKRQIEGKENAANFSFHQGSFSPNAYLVTCSEILPEKMSKGLGEGIISESHFHIPSHKQEARKETDADFSLEGRGVGDYLSVLNSDTELAGLESVRSQRRSKESYAKAQVHCC